jgi:CRISPR-associated endonuclease Cas2
MTTTHSSQLVPHSHATRWLLAHDISDTKRLQRLWRYLSKEGLRLQYSVYFLKGNRAEMEDIANHVLELIDQSADDVRIYALTQHTRLWGLGQQFPENSNMLCDEFLDKMKAYPLTDNAFLNVNNQRLSNETQ